MMPPTAAMNEQSTKAEIRTRSTVMPARREAASLPPTADRWRPYRVRESTKVEATKKKIRTSTTHGTPCTAGGVTSLMVPLTFVRIGLVLIERFWFIRNTNTMTPRDSAPILDHITAL